MQSSRLLPAIAAAMTLALPSLGLADAAPKAVKIEVAQRAGAGPSRNELIRQCQMVTRAVGPVARYRSGGEELNAAELRNCNRLAISVSQPRN